jgi:hypothetical protein
MSRTSIPHFMISKPLLTYSDIKAKETKQADGTQTWPSKL